MEGKCYLRRANSDLGKLNPKNGERFRSCCYGIFRPVYHSLPGEEAGHCNGGHDHHCPEQFAHLARTGRNMRKSAYGRRLQEITKNSHPEREITQILSVSPQEVKYVNSCIFQKICHFHVDHDL